MRTGRALLPETALRDQCQRVLDELDSFTDSSLEDDIALVALEFQGLERSGFQHAATEGDAR